MPLRPPTNYDVAREAKVSIATVSYVVNNGPRSVRPETRSRVVAAMERLKYHPNSLARAMTRKRLNSIGIVFPHPHPHLVADSYYSAILDGIIHVAVSRHQHVMLYTGLEWHGEDSLPAFRDRRVDGFIVIAPLTGNTLIPSLMEVGIPFVQVHGGESEQRVGNVDIDNLGAQRKAVEHLASLGHRRIAHLGGESNSPATVLRRDGFVTAMNEHGLTVDTALVLEGFYDREWGFEGMNRLLSLPDPPTAVLAGGDGIAAGAYKACAKRGVAIPEDLSLIGFDDAPYASLLNPPLTTVRQPLTQMGAAATAMLLDSLDEDVPRERGLFKPVLMPVELIVRESTAICRADGAAPERPCAPHYSGTPATRDARSVPVASS